MRYLVFCVLVLFSLQLSAQSTAEKPKSKDKARKGYLGMYFGPSFPTGHFGNQSWDDEKAGITKRGWQFSLLDFGIKFVPNFGISATVKFSSIPLDVQYLANQYAKEYGGQFTVKASRWGMGGFYVGPFVSIPTKNLDIDFRLLTGFMIAVSPEQTVTQNTTGQTQSRGSEVGSSLSVSVGTGVRYHVSKRMSLMAHAEYQVARPTFVINDYPGYGNQSTTVYQNVSTINTMLGIALRIF